MRQLVHEVGHLWTPRSSDWPNRFAEQGLATYLQVAVARELSGEAAAEAECESLPRAFRRCPQAENVSLLERHVREGLHGVTFCVKGALALVALESLLGRDRFWDVAPGLRGRRRAVCAGPRGHAQGASPRQANRGVPGVLVLPGGLGATQRGARACCRAPSGHVVNGS